MNPFFFFFFFPLFFQEFKLSGKSNCYCEPLDPRNFRIFELCNLTCFEASIINIILNENTHVNAIGRVRRRINCLMVEKFNKFSLLSFLLLFFLLHNLSNSCVALAMSIYLFVSTDQDIYYILQLIFFFHGLLCVCPSLLAPKCVCFWWSFLLLALGFCCCWQINKEIIQKEPHRERGGGEGN